MPDYFINEKKNTMVRVECEESPYCRTIVFATGYEDGKRELHILQDVIDAEHKKEIEDGYASATEDEFRRFLSERCKDLIKQIDL